MTLAPDDLPMLMADEIAGLLPDLDEAACIHYLAAGPHYTMAELIEHMPEAIAIAEMARNSKRDLDEIGAGIAAIKAEMRR